MLITVLRHLVPDFDRLSYVNSVEHMAAPDSIDEHPLQCH